MVPSLLTFQVDIKEMRYAYEISVPLVLQLNDVSSVHTADKHPKVGTRD
jgi:hypothetical protein